MTQASSGKIHSYQNTKCNRLRVEKVNYTLKMVDNGVKECIQKTLGCLRISPFEHINTSAQNPEDRKWAWLEQIPGAAGLE